MLARESKNQHMMHRRTLNISQMASSEEKAVTSKHRWKSRLLHQQSCRVISSNFTPNLCMFVLVVTISFLFHESSAQFVDKDNQCETVNSMGEREYSACIGSPEKLALLGLSATVYPPNATCGGDPDLNHNLYCTLGVAITCAKCDENDPALAHPPENILDNGDNGANTWWQSSSWYDYPTPLHVNVTIAFEHSYQVSDEIKIEFKYGRPQLMILEKSNDYGETWEVYQYYAADELGCAERDADEEGCDGTVVSGCERQFGMPVTEDTALSLPTDVICTNQYSSSVRVSDVDVTFRISDRIMLLTPGRIDVAQLAREFETNTELQSFLTVTDLRFQLLMPATDGLHISAHDDYLGLGKYFYAISNVETFICCVCYLHGKYCLSSIHGNETICECYHNTQGKNCEECLPMYNNKPWRAGSNLPYGNGTANACEKCDCGDHASSCVYNDTLGYGVCTDCQDNTAGNLCEICIDGYYRNETAAISDVDVCIECDCEPLGTVIGWDNATLPCAQYPDEELGFPVGQCVCKDNTRGRACNECEEGFFGLTVEPNVGTCKDCGCDTLGTVNGSRECEQMTGQCICKDSTATRTCEECADMYYGFPVSIANECTACACNPGGATSLVCNKDSGRCSCRANISGRECSNPATLFYGSHLDANSYDAWEASSSCMNTSDVLERSLFGGQGFQRCQSGGQVLFENVKVATPINQTRTFYPTIRYSYSSNFVWDSARLIVTATGNSDVTVNDTCPYDPGTQVWSSAMMFAPGLAVAARPDDDGPVVLDRDCTYEVALEMLDNGDGVNDIDIDGLVLMPNINETLAFEIADSTEQQIYETCLQDMSALSTRNRVIGSCLDFSFSVSAELNGGALRCECDYPMGSLGNVCSAYGGECNCKPGVGGRRCDQCQPGYYGFSDSGCLTCNCNDQGSEFLACDYITGQCPCKAGVALDAELNSNGQMSDLVCDTCLAGYFGFGTEEGCVECGCSEIGSLDSQCDNGGFCTCKPTITGQRCENCVPGYFGFSADGCESCECDPAGTVGSTCHPTVGTCTCKSNVQGAKCDLCKDGFFNMEVNNTDGCQPCFCFSHASVCSSATGYIASEVKTDFTKGRSDGWTTSDPTALNMNPTNVRLSHPPSLEAGTFLYLMAPNKFLKFQLSSYGQKLSYRMKLDTGNIDRTNVKYLVLIGGQTNMTVYYSQEAFEPSIEVMTFEAMLYESYWTIDGEERNPTAAEFLEILSAVGSLQIKASFGTGTASTFYSIAMDSAKVGEAPSSTGYVTTVENCTCNDNTMGMSCGSCEIGHRRTDGLSDPYDSCIACNCNGRATACDPETGVCLDCQLGTMGDQCQSCAANVQEPICDQCMIGHYGSGTDLFGGACEACNCDSVGTSNNPQCDNLSGQCQCTGNYGGMQCDTCDNNFFDFIAGCRPCDACYAGINSQYDGLEASNTNVTDYVAMLLTQNEVLGASPFVERLTNIQSLLSDLVTRTQTVIQEGQDLSGIITSLNSTMFQLLAVLDGPVQEAATLANASVVAVQMGVAAAEEAIASTSMALINAHYALTGGEIQANQLILSSLSSELQQVENDFTTLTAQMTLVVGNLQSTASIMEITADVMVRTAEGAVQLAQDANAIHDNTTGRTAALFVRSNSIDQSLETLATVVEETQQISRDALTESQRKVNEVNGINTGLPATSPVVTDAMGKVQQALQIEQSANNQLAASQSIIDAVNTASIATDTLEADANSTIDTINALYDRVTQANEKALSSQTLVDETFTAAQEMQTTISNFNAQVTAAKNSATNVLNGAQAIVQSSNTIIAQTAIIRNQLSTAASDAAEGLALAEEAFNTAEDEKMNLEPINERANRLNEASTGSSLNDMATTIDAVMATNNSVVHPAGVICDSYTAGIQALETLVNNAAADSAMATTRTSATARQIQQLMNEIQNFGSIETTALEGFRTRIQAAQEKFTAGEYATAIGILKQGVEEQEIWLTETQAEVATMRDQIDALNSFRVSP
ncbi:laminin subunit alpha-1-like [Amphiura filiformis]|uniref:laminin subunit alpha-1-like n=1 Tax=Amphiura filiformis TaxID=82378 RepID=UPI003B220044